MLEEMLFFAEWISSLNVTTVLIFLLFIGIMLYVLSENHLKNLPPGPINIPILGYLPFMIGKNNYVENVYKDLKKKYGDVVYFRLGAKHIVTLNSYDAIKEALVLNPEVAITRPEAFSILNYIHDNTGIIVDNGKIWVEHRRFLMQTLRDLGMGKTSLEYEIREETAVLVGEMGKHCGKPFDIQPLFTNAAANIITALLHGFRFNYNDPEFKELLHMLIASPTRVSPLKCVDSFPYIRYVLPGFLSGLAEVDEAKKLIHQFLDKMLLEHITSDVEATDYTNLYLRQQKEELAKGKANTTFTHVRLRNSIFALNIGGTATVTSTMCWVLKMIIRNPDVQRRLHQEIDRVIGSERTPSFSDKPNMPYTEAFLMEVQRYGDVTPIGAPHSTLGGTKISGYDIPKGSTIMTLLCMVHQDPKIWGDPENFRPERFIGKDGKTIKSEFLIPFSTGKRQCPGERLALMEIFLYTTCLLQNFEFSPATIADAEIEDVTFGFTRDLAHFKLIIQPRNISRKQM